MNGEVNNDRLKAAFFDTTGLSSDQKKSAFEMTKDCIKAKPALPEELQVDASMFTGDKFVYLRRYKYAHAHNPPKPIIYERPHN